MRRGGLQKSNITTVFDGYSYLLYTKFCITEISLFQDFKIYLFLRQVKYIRARGTGKKAVQQLDWPQFPGTTGRKRQWPI